jgi:hypothetical protein
MMGKRGYVPHRDEDDPAILAYIKDLTAPAPAERAEPQQQPAPAG